jgi:pimeloyl-ACP methyl ester carboxylesterase
MRFHPVLGIAVLLLLGRPAAAQQTDSSPPPPRESRFIQLRHLRMYYEVYGQGRPLVLLHGGASTIQASFGRQLADFSRDHLVIAPEQRGHGHTGNVPGAYRYADMTEDTAELLDRLGIRGADVIGWSDGGIVALMLAVRRPDLVRRLVVSGANAVPGTRALTPETRAMLDAYRPGEDTARQREWARLAGDSAGGWTVAIGKLKPLWLTHPTPDELTLADLARVHAPTLVVAGDHDAVRLDHTLEIYRAIPRASLYILPATEHATFRDRAAWVNPVVREFLDAPADAPAAR